MRRLLVTTATILLVVVGVWLASKPIARFSLGPGELVLTRPGVDRLLVGDGSGGWILFRSNARQPEHGRPLPAGLSGRPVLDAHGVVWGLADDRLLSWRTPQVPATSDVIAGRSLEGAVLLAAAGAGPPLLALPAVVAAGASDAGGYQLHELVRGPGAEAAPQDPAQGLLRLRAIAAGALPARITDLEALVISRWSPAFAFRGTDGWEAWSRPADRPADDRADRPAGGSAGDGVEDGWTRVVARGHHKPGAVFTPDGGRLILEGRVDGLWLLSLRNGRLEFMSDGNLGRSKRVPNDMSFLRGSAPVLFAGQWTLDGQLHMTHAHLGGGGRYQPKVGLFHDYGPALSWDGILLVYCQSEFDEQGSAPFDEALYCMDRTQPDVPAVFVDDRAAGLPDQGPVFVGTSTSFVYIADGEVRGVDFQHSLQSPP